MPFNPPADSDVLTATLLLSDVWNQVIAQVTSGSRPAGTEGQVIYETDTGAFQAHNGSTWIEFGRTAGSTTWTPTVAQGASSDITKTINTAFYIRLGNVVFAWCDLTMTAGGSAGSAVTVTLPVANTTHATSNMLGAGHIIDASTAANCGPVGVGVNSSTTVHFRFSGVTSGAWGAAPNTAIANTDAIRFQVNYLTA